MKKLTETAAQNLPENARREFEAMVANLSPESADTLALVTNFFADPSFRAVVSDVVYSLTK